MTPATARGSEEASTTPADSMATSVPAPIAIPLAAGALAWAGITLAPAVGGILMSISTVVVALNAQVLRRLDLRPEALAIGVTSAERTQSPATRVV